MSFSLLDWSPEIIQWFLQGPHPLQTNRFPLIPRFVRNIFCCAGLTRFQKLMAEEDIRQTYFVARLAESAAVSLYEAIGCHAVEIQSVLDLANSAFKACCCETILVET